MRNKSRRPPHIGVAVSLASGNTDEDVVACIKAGVAIVHINTELRVLYRDSLRESLKSEETTPYKFLTPAVEAMKDYIVKKQRLFAGQQI